MKRTILILSFLLVNTFAFSQGQPEDKERVRIANSKVQKSTQWTHKYSQGKVNLKGYITTESKYDERGNVIEVINYKSNGQISSKLQYKYDKNNNRIEYLKFEKKDKPDFELTYKQSFTYDDKGNKKIENGYDGISPYKIIYSYLANGKTKDITKYASDNSIIEKWESSYNNNVQTINVLKLGKNLDYVLVRKIDVRGNTIEETRNDPKGKEVSRILSGFDANNYITSNAEYYSGKLSKKFTYKYNKQYQLLEIIQVNPDGSESLNRAYKYDSKGNLLEEKWFDGIPNEFSSKNFKYDDKSNPAEVESYYSDYKYKVLYKYTYEYY
ncbi:MAG: hypothetical protein EHM93_02985 [Bacteroidales bacterium]|nr:MAG: hypothetical protein EHM93_02985 [Bacteroidales bacterium]